jgi:prevent-host-death family protein
MTVVNIHEAKTNLSRLLDAAVAGEEVIIAKGGRPFVKLAPVIVADRTPGAAKGKGRVTEAFFESLPEEELEAWQ